MFRLMLLVCCLAYLLDLRAKFVPKETARAEYEAWRIRAMALEEKLEQVEIKYQSEHVGMCLPQLALYSCSFSVLSR